MLFFIGILTILSTVINLIYSYFERIENFFWNWPAYGLIAIGMAHDHAYATAVMQIIQALISTHGFFIWTESRKYSWKERLFSAIHDRDHKKYKLITIKLSTMTFKQHFYSLLLILVIFEVVYFILQYTNDLSPLIDSIVFAIAAVAAVLLNIKKIESWIYYIISDFCALLLAYQAKDLYTFISISLFVILNTIIFIRWNKNKSSDSKKLFNDNEC